MWMSVNSPVGERQGFRRSLSGDWVILKSNTAGGLLSIPLQCVHPSILSLIISVLLGEFHNRRTDSCFPPSLSLLLLLLLLLLILPWWVRNGHCQGRSVVPSNRETQTWRGKEKKRWIKRQIVPTQPQKPGLSVSSPHSSGVCSELKCFPRRLHRPSCRLLSFTRFKMVRVFAVLMCGWSFTESC